MSKLKKNKRIFRAPALKYLIITNVIGMMMYLYFTSWGWAPLGEEGLLEGPGDPIIWVFTAFPVLMLCFVINVMWIVAILFRRDWRLVMNWLLVVIVWGGVFSYDASRQYNGSKATGSNMVSTTSHK